MNDFGPRRADSVHVSIAGSIRMVPTHKYTDVATRQAPMPRFRRELLRGLGTVGAIGLTGCTGSGPADTTTGTATTTGDATTEPTTGNTTAIEESTVIDESGRYTLAADLSTADTCLRITGDDVTLDGRGRTITGDDPEPNQHGIHITGDNVTVTDLTVRGWDDQGAGIVCQATTGGTLGSVTTTGNHHGLLLDQSSSTTVTDSTITGNTESGAFLRAGRNNRLAGNTITDNAGASTLGGIHMERVTGAELAKNELRANSDTAIIAIDCDDNRITDNELHDNGRHGVFLDGSSNNTLRGNTATENAISGIDLAFESTNNTIESNTLTDNAGHGLWLLESRKNEITDNTTSGNEQVGIILADASANTLAGNTVADNTVGGIDLIGESEYTSRTGSNDNTVRDNDVRNNQGTDGAGIRLRHSDGNRLAENTVRGTATHGIEVVDAADTDIEANTVTGNDGDGIHLAVKLTGVTVTGNTVRGNSNGVAVAIQAAGGVTITGNDIVENEAYGVVVRDHGTGEIPEASAETPTVDATSNWWGAGSGPTHPGTNPGGTGGRVSDNVAFQPWADASQTSQ